MGKNRIGMKDSLEVAQSALAAIPIEHIEKIKHHMLLDHQHLSNYALALGCRVVGTNLCGGLYLAKQGAKLLLTKDTPL